VKTNDVASMSGESSGSPTAATVEHNAPSENVKPPLALDPAFVLNFTHQIINPLNGIVGTVDNLIDGTISEQRRPQRLRALRAQLSHIIELVRNLAYLSQLSTDQGREGLRKAAGEVNLPSVIIEAMQFFQEKGVGRGIQLELLDRASQYVVRGQVDLLRQVFLNLFENATKYADLGTKAEVAIRPQKSTRALIVEVTNAGPGFPYRERELLFEAGFRGDIARATVASGSGLGLYICREILHLAHGASIEAEHSERKRLTTFRIRFPSYTLEEEESEQWRRALARKRS
jgi:signal transduction histidine kinase